jgi:hypothetical protein
MSQSPGTQANGHNRTCPTRVDERPVLFAHKVTTAQCQDRQRGRYHKCFTCAHSNAWVAAKGGKPVRAAADSTPQESKLGSRAQLASL